MIDITVSQEFLNAYPKMPRGRVLDVGAGIGRVSKYLLVENFQKVDLLDPAEELLKKAAGFIASEKIGILYNRGL